ncbi:hypothetical protein [Hydrogenophaga sp. PAMC20947]|uniref:hypothetical protein n=1 Tax=Hydrogenophaga sp. PAMC20947 TaxID=2565558 RepID=UPI00109DDD0C|nr:hypothetical protein [Hydrogenophaga sp. PAMC20947]QCB47998.1 hypothetical protein E5678_19370 [Hydrogenophaga sp. PAMC20947]
MSDPKEFAGAVYAKTVAGQQEIQTRSLGLAPLVRRLLVLVDGKRSAADLAVFVPAGQSVEQMFGELLAQGCVELRVKPQATDAGTGVVPESLALDDPDTDLFQPPVDAAIPGLPPAAVRSAKENEMARNFMINSINSIIGQNMRISLIHDIFHAETTEQLRVVFHAWEYSMSNNGMGNKRLPELREKLFKVL